MHAPGALESLTRMILRFSIHPRLQALPLPPTRTDLLVLALGLERVRVDGDEGERGRSDDTAAPEKRSDDCPSSLHLCARPVAHGPLRVNPEPAARRGNLRHTRAVERRIQRMSEHRLPERDRPWVMRTYAGHSDARRSNELYRRNLAKGQTGLSVAFDLPTQTGYDPDHVLARGEVGKVGVSIANKGDMHALLDGIPLDEMNTSMTINATAAWLLGLYVTVAEENGVERDQLKGTTQNDIIKEYLSRGTYAFPPGPSMRLIADTVAFTSTRCRAGTRPTSAATTCRRPGRRRSRRSPTRSRPRSPCSTRSRRRGQVAEEDFPKVFGRISFFVNAGVRFIEEHAKLRAMSQLWEELGRERYGVTDPKFLRMRYGVQVNSLGLTEAQPENNVPRIVLEALAVTMGRNARARAIQLPAWNEALGLPRPWDQQWSLRIQQILAFETDMLDYPDIFEGSNVMEGLVAELTEGARDEMKVVADQGGAVDAVPYMKSQLVESHRASGRPDRARRDDGRRPEPLHRERGLAADRRRRRRHPHPRPRGRARAHRGAGALEGRARQRRRRAGAGRARRGRRRRVRERDAGDDRGGQGRRDHRRVGADLRDVFGDYRAPTGVSGSAMAGEGDELEAVRARVEEVSARIGHRPRILVGKPGLDGHSNGAEQIAVRARDVGMEVIYQGIRLTPEQIATSAIQEDVDVVGLSILSGSHLWLVPETVRLLREQGVERAGRRRRDHPRRRRRAPARGRGRRRLHAQGLRHEPDHERDRRPRRGAGRVGGRLPRLSAVAAAALVPIEFPIGGIVDGDIRIRLRADADIAGDRRRLPGPRDPALDPGALRLRRSRRRATGRSGRPTSRPTATSSRS